MPKPIAVTISDVHFDLSTLEIATASFKAAINKAEELQVPLIDAGDLTHTKAILRAEVVNKLLELVSYAHSKGVKVYNLVGNHSLINSNSTDSNALNFLAPFWIVITKPCTRAGFNFIPYQPKPELFMKAIQKFPKGSIVIGHQGTTTGNKGDYVHDHAAVNVNDIKPWRVFLGHFHQHYVLGNSISIGNPYTLTFGEANDGPKGFLVLYDDGSFERVILPYRKHIILDKNVNDSWHEAADIKPDDLVWVKMRGPRSELEAVTKKQIADLLGRTNFKLDKFPTGGEVIKPTAKVLTSEETFDKVIDASGETPEQKLKLKALWRELCA